MFRQKIFFLSALLICWHGGLWAEGTAQLIPAGASSGCVTYVQGNDGSGKEGPGYGRPETDLLHIRITDPSTETIYMGFTRKLPSSKSVYYQVLDPDGNIHCTGKVAESSGDPGYIDDNGVEAYVGPQAIGGATGYQAITCTPDQAGDYILQFNVSDSLIATPGETKYFVHPFDVTVADVSNPSNITAIDGRLYTYRWHLNTNSGSNKACMDFYTWTPDSLVMKMEMNEIQPFGFTVSFNSTGTANTGDIVADRQSTTSTSSTIPEYPVFLNEPDENAFPSGTPGEVTYIEVNACTQDDSYCIVVNTTKVGEMNVYIDLDGDGIFSTNGIGKDVYFPYRNSASGEICIPWDGIDGDGDTIDVDTKGLVKVEFLAGIVHFPIWDAENHTNGFNCQLIRPVGFAPKMYFDNSNTSIGTSDLSGCTSNCNSWGSSQGNNTMVNTWLNTITSSDEDSIIIGAFCPPQAENDTLCTRPGHGIQASILNNDFDPNNDLDTSSVVVETLESSEGSASFSTETALLTFFPNGTDSTTVSFLYSIQDLTDEDDGGPFVDTAEVIIYISSSCTASTVLPIDPILLRGRLSPRGIELNWEALLTANGPMYKVEKSSDGKRFKPIYETKTTRFTDMGIPPRHHKPRPITYYRIKMKDLAGEKAVSNVIEFRIKPPSKIDFQFYQQQKELFALKYKSPEPCLFALYDMDGQLIHSQSLPPALFRQKINVKIPGREEGIYLVSLLSENFYESRKIYIR
ncbi:MAG: Ig-like domain-containing protein [Bacteroidia bacterium]|nr:Ig-like domain-containing protein [Bacteroidia bacterium]